MSRPFSFSKPTTISASSSPRSGGPFGIWWRRHPDRASLALPDLPVPPARFRDHYEYVWTVYPETWTHPATARRFSYPAAAVDGPYEPVDGIPAMAGATLC